VRVVDRIQALVGPGAGVRALEVATSGVRVV
jgi:hypothetical protein